MLDIHQLEPKKSSVGRNQSVRWTGFNRYADSGTHKRKWHAARLREIVDCYNYRVEKGNG